MPTKVNNENELQEINLCDLLNVEEGKLVQLVHKLVRNQITYPCLVQEKYDGCYCIAYRHFSTTDGNNHVKIFSRTGKQYLSMEHLEKCFDKMFNGTNKDFIIFEAYIPNVIQSDISGAVRDTQAQHPEIIAVIHDVLSRDEYLGGTKTSYERRYADLKILYSMYHYPSMMFPNSKICFNWKEIQDYAQTIFDRGGEGVVIKKLQASYHRGKRDYTLMKYKQEVTYDLEVVDMQEGTGQFKNACGALIVRFSGNRNIPVGTGLTKEQRKLFWNNRDMAIGRIAEIKAMRLTSSGLLREPRFKGFRDDKEVADY